MKTSVKLLLAALVIAVAFIALHTGASAQGEQSNNQKRENKFRKSKKPVRNQYIVVLKSETPSDEVEAVANEFLGKHGGTVRHIYKYALKGFSIELPEAAALALSRDPRVAYVEEDTEATLQKTEQTTNWNLDRIDQRQGLSGSYYYPNDETGAGVHAYIIDTGIKAQHREFSNPDGSNNRATKDVDFVWWNNTGGDDCNFHGTAVAGIIGGRTFGVSKAVRLHGIRVADCEGDTDASTIMAGVDWVTNAHTKPAVANISINVPVDPLYAIALEEAIRASIAAGVTYVVAAGNGNSSDLQGITPARIPEVITVGATNSSDARASFSNFGPGVDLFAPGENVRSAAIFDSDGDGIFDAPTGSLQGTSFAAPHVAGVAARMLPLIQIPSSAQALITGAILNSATKNAITNPGEGSNNFLLFADLRHAFVARATVGVPEDFFVRDTGVDVGPGQWLAMSGSGHLTAFPFAPENGPQGWNWIESDATFPLPFSRPYSLIGNLNGETFYIGTSRATSQSFTSPQRLRLRTNDNVPGDGSGGFFCDVQLWNVLPEARADFILQSVPSVMLTGQVWPVVIRMKNVGPTTWTTTQHNLKLQVLNAWGPNTVPLPGSVAPGEEVSFMFEIKAPLVPGTFDFQWRMNQEGVQRFGDKTTLKQITVVSASNNAQFISQSVPSSMYASEMYEVSITMKNIGNTEWPAGSAFKLGSQNPQDNTTWGLSRVNVPHTVYPGQQVTFTFNVMAPAQTGNKNFQWKMVKEFVEWFGSPTDNKVVSVKPHPCPDC